MGKKHKKLKKILKKEKLHKVAFLSTEPEPRPVCEHVEYAIARYLEKAGRRLEKGKATSEKEYDTFKEIAHSVLGYYRYHQ